MTSSLTPRRGFLERAAAALVGLAAAPAVLRGQAAAAPPADEAWLQNLSGKHRQFFDVSVVRDGRSLARVANFLDAYAEAYNLRDADLNAVFGAHSAGLGFIFNDAIWAKYELGTRYAENDPVTKAPATRNPYAHGLETSVARLQQRGVRFLACMRSVRRLSVDLAGGDRNAADAIRVDLTSNLLPGVTAVPAMVVAINRAQEAGLTYVFVG
jgi:intracellular sulfur oxidation DsrE/DsrF family protein